MHPIGIGECLSQRRPQLNAIGELETGRHHSRHLTTRAVEHDRLSDEVWISAKTPAPQTMTQKRHRIAARFVLFRQKGAAQRRPDTERRKEFRRDLPSDYSLRLAIAGKSKVHLAKNGDLLEDVILRAPIEEIRVGNKIPLRLRTKFGQAHQPI